MGLSVGQILEKRVAAHNLSNLQEAERLLREDLKNQPDHSDANSNLELIASSVNQSKLPLPR